MIIPIAKAYVGELSPRGEEGTWMGYYNTAFFAGIGSGPLIGGILYDTFSANPPLFGTLDSGMVAAFSAMGLLNMLAAITVFFFLPEIKQEPGKTRPKPSYRTMSRSGPFLGLMSLRLVEGLGRSSFFAFIPIFAGLQLGLSTTQIGTIITTQVLLSALLQAPMGKITDKISSRVSRRSMIIGGGIIIVIYMCLAPMATHYWHLLGISITAGIVSSITTPTGSVIAVSEGRKFGMASVMATVSIAISAGMALGPFLGGIIVEATNQGLPEGATQDVTGVFYFGAFFVLLGFSLFAWFTRPQREKEPGLSLQDHT
jgi:MFS family permease